MSVAEVVAMVEHSTCTVRRGNGEVVLVVTGEVDLANAGALYNAARSLGSQLGSRDVVVDLSGVRFIDSGGIHALIRAQGEVVGRLMLRNPSSAARRVLDIVAPGAFIMESPVDTGVSPEIDVRVDGDAVVLETTGIAPPDRKLPMSHDAHADALAALSQFLVADVPLGETLHRVAQITIQAIPSAAFAGMSMLDQHGRPSTPIYTAEDSPQIDAAQYEAGKGPCLDAWRTQSTVRIDDLKADGDRYPEFAAAALEHGVLSTLSLPMAAGGVGMGALNMYAYVAAGFSADDEALAQELTDAASVVLANATAYWQAFDLSEHYNEAMKSRAVIEQAKGMLMARSETLTADDAFELLRSASQRENVKLRHIAQRIVDRQPPPQAG
jgi:anti-anti-sigma factor